MSPGRNNLTLSGVVAARLAAMSAMAAADCTLRSNDGHTFQVHKLKLIEQPQC
jgi:hypothetical protein